MKKKKKKTNNNTNVNTHNKTCNNILCKIYTHRECDYMIINNNNITSNHITNNLIHYSIKSNKQF